MAYVTCPFCKVKFNKLTTDHVQVASRRYAHTECYRKSLEQSKENAKDYLSLEIYIKKLFQIETLTPLISKQIKDFKEKNGYSYKDMTKSLMYFYSVQGNTTDKSNGGIGIIPFVHDRAISYFDEIDRIRQANKDISEPLGGKETVVIPTPKVRRKKRGPFSFLMEDTNGETK